MDDLGGGWQRCGFALRDGIMAGLRLGARAEALSPRLMFLHATGLNARTYCTLLHPIAAHADVLALDLRGHGRSALPARVDNYSSWDIHAQDVLAVIDAHGPGPVVLAGHSMGAIVALLAAAERPDRVRALCLIEPVIFPPLFYLLARAPGAGLARRHCGPMRQVAKRRAHFASLEDALAHLTGRGIFASFTPEALRDYLGDGLRPAAEGLTLACDPAFEAATFAAQGHAPFAALSAVRLPITVLRARHGSTFVGPAAAIVARRWPSIRIETVADAGHMLPMEKPEIARTCLIAAVEHLSKKGMPVFAPDVL